MKSIKYSDHILAQAVRFSVVGGTGYLLYLVWYYGAIEMGVSQFIAIVTAPFANIIYNFFLHRGWTFKRRI